MQHYVPTMPAASLVYCDPPYFQQGHRLYLSKYQPADHSRIAGVIQNQLSRPWIVSYDGAPEILEFYEGRRRFLYDLQNNAQRVHKGKEVFVFDDTLQLPTSSKIKTINAAIEAAAVAA